MQLNTCFPCLKEAKTFSKMDLKTALDLNNCLNQIKLQISLHAYAIVSELPSDINYHGGEWDPDEPPEHGDRHERGAGEPERAD